MTLIVMMTVTQRMGRPQVEEKAKVHRPKEAGVGGGAARHQSLLLLEVEVRVGEEDLGSHDHGLGFGTIFLFCFPDMKCVLKSKFSWMHSILNLL